MNKITKRTNFAINYYGFLHLFKRELKKLREETSYSLISSTLNMALYLFIFGSLVGEHVNLKLEDSYLNFIMPGILMMNITTSSFLAVSSSLFQAKVLNYIEETLCSPLSSTSLVAAYTAIGILKGFLSGLVVLVTVYAINQTLPTHFFLLLYYIFLSSCLFSLLGFLCAFKAKSIVFLTNIQNYFFTPFVLLGGVYYSVSTISPIWATVTKCNPGYYFVRSFRFATTGLSEFSVGHISFSIIILSSLILLFSSSLYLVNNYEKNP